VTQKVIQEETDYVLKKIISARESLDSDIPAGDWKIACLSVQCGRRHIRAVLDLDQEHADSYEILQSLWCFLPGTKCLKQMRLYDPVRQGTSKESHQITRTRSILVHVHAAAVTCNVSIFSFYLLPQTTPPFLRLSGYQLIDVKGLSDNFGSFQDDSHCTVLKFLYNLWGLGTL
jgi:hypothetical protein